MTDHNLPAGGEVVAPPQGIEQSLFTKDRSLRLVRSDEEGYQGWYLREVPDEKPLLFLDHGQRPLLYDVLEQALEHLRHRDLSIYIED